MKKNKIRLDEEEQNETAEVDPSQILLLSPEFPNVQEENKVRTITLYGEVSEERASEIILSLLYLGETACRPVFDESDPEKEPEIIFDPLEFVISTYGGSASEMFAIYDVMRKIRETCDIETYGVGKVMSAGVLLLAAGTKGKRKIGKNCRVMMHSVAGGSFGSLHNLENEMDEIKWLQEQHTKCLIEETDMSRRQIKKMLAKRMNVYLTAEQAVELGIADEIV